MIPNICHFVFGLKEQQEDFKFCHYLAVLSASLINSPDKIVFHYHYEPRGLWWEEVRRLPRLELRRVNVPSTLGQKPLTRVAHKADVVRMSALYQHGGVYLDIDTICVRPWRDLLGYQIVLGKEEEVPGIPPGICNAVMMARPRCKFLAEWMIRYPFEYNPEGWREASIILPFKIATAQPDWLTLKGPETFFTPGWHQYRRIFSGSHPISEDLIVLHLWESYSSREMNEIQGWEWCDEHPDTLYGRIMKRIRQTKREQEQADCRPGRRDQEPRMTLSTCS